ncbi:hypothetical protein NHX12_006260, partial [Muraenolepis orangiensis]
RPFLLVLITEDPGGISLETLPAGPYHRGSWWDLPRDPSCWSLSQRILRILEGSRSLETLPAGPYHRVSWRDLPRDPSCWSLSQRIL